MNTHFRKQPRGSIVSTLGGRKHRRHVCARVGEIVLRSMELRNIVIGLRECWDDLERKPVVEVLSKVTCVRF